MQNGDVMDQMVGWLEGFAWTWFVTLTFRPIFTEAQARYRMLKWCEELDRELGTGDFEFVGVPEYGAGGQFHYHLLIGGLRLGIGAEQRLEWGAKWWKLAGDARIDDYRPGIGGIRYILKYVDPDDMDEIEFHLCAHTGMDSGSGGKQ